MNDFDPEDLERITARAEEMLARVEELRSEIDVAVGHGVAADGQVRVTVGPSGRLTEVELAPRAMRMDSRRLAEAMLRAAQEAQDDVARKVEAVMAGGLGGDLPDDHFSDLLESYEASMEEQLRALGDGQRDTR
ncbi:YbaB/EbfC family DNA-binding protein [Nonomuraea mesophila]|uniref:YbaB/EbfC family DNA-binding protein n=1 Tax=Nonomuraea mesophila TaxID=2530382 RepID=A0A4R5F285_9ACTN|nr:YbaB/EbfC family nucleoid-associated protein [Nonomuraea mesophila]TDE41581.1 YbaB/EbfC family DNA-binding protein [Nonomuraea mesophila]